MSVINDIQEDRRRAALAFRNSVEYASAVLFAKDKRDLVLDMATRWYRAEMTDEQVLCKLREIAMDGYETHGQKVRAVNEGIRQLTADARPARALPEIVEDEPQGWCQALGRMLSPEQWAERFDADANEYASVGGRTYSMLARVCRARAESLRERGFEPNPEKNLAWLKKLSDASRRAGLTADA